MQRAFQREVCTAVENYISNIIKTDHMKPPKPILGPNLTDKLKHKPCQVPPPPPTPQWRSLVLVEKFNYDGHEICSFCSSQQITSSQFTPVPVPPLIHTQKMKERVHAPQWTPKQVKQPILSAPFLSLYPPPPLQKKISLYETRCPRTRMWSLN